MPIKRLAQIPNDPLKIVRKFSITYEILYISNKKYAREFISDTVV